MTINCSSVDLMRLEVSCEDLINILRRETPLDLSDPLDDKESYSSLNTHLLTQMKSSIDEINSFWAYINKGRPRAGAEPRKNRKKGRPR